MLFDVVHDLGLLIADVECAGGSVSGWGEVGVDSFFRGVDVADAFVEDESPLAAHELQHKDEEEDFGINFAILALDDPPHLLVVHVEELLHKFFVPLQGEFESGIEVGGEVEELWDGVPAGRKEQIFKAVGKGEGIFRFALHDLLFDLYPIQNDSSSLQLHIESGHCDSHCL